MRTIGRTLAILLAALLVAGAVYGLGNAGLLGGAQGGPPAGAAVGQGGPPSGEFQAGEGRGQGGHSEGGGAVEVGKNLAIIAVIVGLVAGGAALARQIWPGARPKGPPAAAAG